MSMMTADDVYNLRAYPRHFDLEGIPVCVVSTLSAPRAYLGAGNWESLPESDRLLVGSVLVTPRRFETLCQQIDDSLENDCPFLNGVRV